LDRKEEIIAQIDEINAMPVVTLDLMGLLNEQGTTITDLSRKVKSDEALAAFILKNCNSPLYGIKSEIKSILQALTLLGFSRIKSILMTYINKNLYNISGKSEIKNKLWRHSVSVASFSQAIATHIKVDTEEAYLAGLLHDIGKLIIYNAEQKIFEKVLTEIELSGSESYLIETKFLGFNHMEIGSLIMEKWKFSNNLIESAQFHHTNLNIGNNKFIGVVAFANEISHSEHDAKSDIKQSPFLKEYNISYDKLKKIIDYGLNLEKEYLGF